MARSKRTPPPVPLLAAPGEVLAAAEALAVATARLSAAVAEGPDACERQVGQALEAIEGYRKADPGFTVPG